MIQWECIQICEKTILQSMQKGTNTKGKPCRRENHAKGKTMQKRNPHRKKNLRRRKTHAEEENHAEGKSMSIDIKKEIFHRG